MLCINQTCKYTLRSQQGCQTFEIFHSKWKDKMIYFKFLCYLIVIIDGPQKYWIK